MADAIRVCVRVRPTSDTGSCGGDGSSGSNVWDVEGNTIRYHGGGGGLEEGYAAAAHTVDSVCGVESGTQALYDSCVRDLIECVTEGINGTVFAYGQTGSGKTYTMSGSAEEPGVVPMAVGDIFAAVDRQQESREFLLRCSYMEIYNEEINDLLSGPNATGGKKLQVLETNGVPYVAGLTEEVVTSPEHVMEVLARGDRSRRVGSTNMNARSSRSHSLFRMVVESRDIDDIDAVKVSTLMLVDLAGSERLSKTGATGGRAREGVFINKSLLTLSNVITKLSEIESSGAALEGHVHVPYRDSKLTRILQPSLGGNARTTIICAVNPSREHAEETVGTLRFATRAKKVQNSAVVNEVVNEAALLCRQKREIESLRMQLKQANSANSADAAAGGPLDKEFEDQIRALRNALLEKDQANELISLQLQEEKAAKERQKRQIDSLTSLVKNTSAPSTAAAAAAAAIGCAQGGQSSQDASATEVEHEEVPLRRQRRGSRRETWCPGLLPGAASTFQLKPLALACIDEQQHVAPVSVAADSRPVAASPALSDGSTAASSDSNSCSGAFTVETAGQSVDGLHGGEVTSFSKQHTDGVQTAAEATPLFDVGTPRLRSPLVSPASSLATSEHGDAPDGGHTSASPVVDGRTVLPVGAETDGGPVAIRVNVIEDVRVPVHIRVVEEVASPVRVSLEVKKPAIVLNVNVIDDHCAGDAHDAAPAAPAAEAPPSAPVLLNLTVVDESVENETEFNDRIRHLEAQVAELHGELSLAHERARMAASQESEALASHEAGLRAMEEDRNGKAEALDAVEHAFEAFRAESEARTADLHSQKRSLEATLGLTMSKLESIEKNSAGARYALEEELAQKREELAGTVSDLQEVVNANRELQDSVRDLEMKLAAEHRERQLLEQRLSSASAADRDENRAPLPARVGPAEETSGEASGLREELKARNKQLHKMMEVYSKMKKKHVREGGSLVALENLRETKSMEFELDYANSKRAQMKSKMTAMEKQMECLRRENASLRSGAAASYH